MNSRSEADKVPPTLGTVLIITFWRYIITPVIVLAIVYGFRQIPSTRVYLYDPAFVSETSAKWSAW